MATIPSMKITFRNNFLQTSAIPMMLLSNHTFFDQAEYEFRPPQFSKSLFYKMWDKELKYIMLVSMKCGVDFRQKHNLLFICRLIVGDIISKDNYVEGENNLSV